jgi:hypothetical protein
MGHNGCLMFCQITAEEERRVTRRIVVEHDPSQVFPTIQESSCAQLHSNALNVLGTNVYLPSDHVVYIYDGQCLSNKKNRTNITLIFDGSSVLFLIGEAFLHLPECLVKQLKCLCKIFTKFAATFHAHTRTHTHTHVLQVLSPLLCH